MTFSNLKEPRPGDVCLVCNSEPSIIGVFVPQEPGAWGGIKNKARFFRYCLCERCNRRLDKVERVEKIIRAELAGGSVTHAE
jgi:hypothetical protein